MNGKPPTYDSWPELVRSLFGQAQAGSADATRALLAMFESPSNDDEEAAVVIALIELAGPEVQEEVRKGVVASMGADGRGLAAILVEQLQRVDLPPTVRQEYERMLGDLPPPLTKA